MISRKRLPQFLLLTLLSTVLVGCKPPPTYDVIEGEVDHAKNGIDINENQQYTRPAPVLTQTGAYVDTKKISLTRPPSWLKQHVTLHGSNLPLSFYTNQLLEQTGAMVRYDSSVDQKRLLSVDYSGTIKGALDDISSITDYAYDLDYKKNTLTWSDFVNKTFDVSFVPGSVDFALGGSSVSAEDAGADQQAGYDITEDSQNSQLSGSPSVWNDMLQTINNLKSEDGKVTVSQSTTTITLHDHPSNVAAVTDYIERINQELTKQVRIQVRIIEVQLNKQFEMGIDWDVVNQSSRRLLNFTSSTFTNITQAASSPQSLQVNILTGPWAGTNTFLRLLQEQGKASIITQPTIVTLNNQPAQVVIQNQQNYVSKIENTVSDGGATSGVETGTVSTGLNLYVLPKIRHDDLILQINGTLSALLSLDSFSTTSGSNPNVTADDNNTVNVSSQPDIVQLPNVNMRNINQRAILHDGETLILTGFKSLGSRADNAKVLFSQALGSKSADNTNVELIFLITPTILSTQDKLLEDEG